ncbi:MAG: BamA/TamA family outer membrane protein [Acidobacteria bacterium]|nr:BamA/TamA family outer membrane protein [Acidobacteriota bacterium]
MLLFLVAAGAAAQQAKYQGRRVAEVVFLPEQQPLEPAEIEARVPLRVGAPLRMADIQTSIERLYATGRYEDIQVDAEPVRDGGVAIRFLTRESRFIGHVSVRGNLSDPPNPGQLVNATRLDLGQPFTDDKLADAEQSIRHLLQSNGLYQSTVHPEFDYDPAVQQVHIRFVVDSGPRARFEEPDLQGDLKLPPAKIVAATHWRKWLLGGWKQVTQARVRQGVEKVRAQYEKQGRLEAKVGLSLEYDSDANRVRPTLGINAGPRIQVTTVGAKLSQKKLRQYIPIFEEHTVDRELLVEGARNLQDYFQNQGFFEVEIEPKEQRVTNDRATIDYLINTGQRHSLAYIGIQGNRYFSTDTIRERMYLQKASLLQFRHGRYSGRLLRQDENSIVDLYRSNGFRDVAVHSRIADNYKGKSGDIAVFLTINEGPQRFVNSLQIEGIHHLNPDQVRQELSCAAGQPFSEYNVSVDRDAILRQYFSQGFSNATFEWSSKPAAEPNRVDLRFVITEGQQQIVRQVLTNGLKVTSPKLVNEFITLKPGDPLSPAQVTDTQKRLYDLGIFSKVDAAVQNPDGETTRKYVVYDVEEARRFSIATGFGAEVARIGRCQTCLDAPAGQAGFAPRVLFDISRLNLWGLGHSLSLRTRVSTLERRGLLTYSLPRFEGDDNLNLSFTALYDKSLNVWTFSSNRLEGSTQLTQRVSRATTLFYRYTYRRVSVDTATLKISPLLIPQLSQPVRVGLVSWNLLQDRRDDPVDPHKGIYNTVDISLAAHGLGSQVNFFRFLGRNATYHPIGRKLVLARDTSFGNISPFHYRGRVDEAVPLAERFFSGGGDSQRGFPDQQAGPRDLVTGFPLGGNALFFNQIELRFPLIGENIGGVLFHDAGNVYSSLGKVSFRVHQHGLEDFNYMVHAVGFGLRYRTPIGPVRVDLAYSINPPRFFGFKGALNDLLNAGVTPCSSPLYPNRCVAQSTGHFQYFFSIGQTF